LTEKEMKKLNRYQLLELLIIQTEEVNTLRQQLQEAQKALENRNIQMESIGSIAEASLHLEGVFDAAQNAVDLFLAEAKKRISEMEAQAAEEAQRIIEEAKQRARQLLENAENGKNP